MSDISDAQLRRLDMTLLLVFEETMAAGKLSAAARRLGLTQSAVSHALGRLREIFGDPLFVRRPHGVEPTPRARALRAPLGEALRLIAGALRPGAFDPAGDARVFRVAASDHLTSVFGPLLAREPAEGARFIFRHLLRGDAIAAVVAGEVDLAIGYFPPRVAGCDGALLYQENYSVVARRGHPALRGRLDLAAYLRFPHVLASPGGTLDGIVDATLRARGLARTVKLAVPYFLAAMAAAAGTDLLATVPRRLGLLHARSFRLEMAPPPVAIRTFEVGMIWSRRAWPDPALAWLSARVRALAAEITAREGAGADPRSLP